MQKFREFNNILQRKLNPFLDFWEQGLLEMKQSMRMNTNIFVHTKKTITPFTAEVFAAVFASAENSPLEYVIKSFYPNKNLYPEQIQKLPLFERACINGKNLV